jgi:hypothetical protein
MMHKIYSPQKITNWREELKTFIVAVAEDSGSGGDVRPDKTRLNHHGREVTEMDECQCPQCQGE